MMDACNPGFSIKQLTVDQRSCAKIGVQGSNPQEAGGSPYQTSAGVSQLVGHCGPLVKPQLHPSILHFTTSCVTFFSQLESGSLALIFVSLILIVFVARLYDATYR